MSCATIRSFWLVGALLMLLDSLSTWYALQLGLSEGNPFARWSMGHLGVRNDLILKVLLCVPMVWMMAYFADWGIRRSSKVIFRLAVTSLVVTVVWMTIVVSNNFTLIALTA